MNKIELMMALKEKGMKEAATHDKMFVTVLIRDKKFKQFCGDGKQKMRWLTDCAIYKYEIANETKGSCGPAYGLKMENGTLCDLNTPIKSTLVNGSNVLVLLKEEYDVEIDERRKKCNNQNVNLVNNFYDEGNDEEEEEYSNEEDYHSDENENMDDNEEKHYLPKDGDDDNNNEEYDDYDEKEGEENKGDEEENDSRL